MLNRLPTVPTMRPGSLVLMHHDVLQRLLQCGALSSMYQYEPHIILISQGVRVR